MRTILVNVQPKQAQNILNNKQTLILYESVPKGFVGWVYMYVAKKRPYLCKENSFNIKTYTIHTEKMVLKFLNVLNGLVIARWWSGKNEKIEYEIIDINEYEHDVIYSTKTLCGNELLYKSCVDYDDIDNVIGGNGKNLYAWHIRNLEVLKEPMKLMEFYKNNSDRENLGSFGWAFTEKEIPNRIPIKRAPSSWKYVWLSDEKQI